MTSIIPRGRFVEYQNRRDKKGVQPLEQERPRAVDRAEHRIALPRVHIAGSNAYYDAHLDVGQHGFALFLTPDAAAPMLEIDGTLEQLDALLHDLQAALAAKRTRDATTESDPVQMLLANAEMETASDL